MLPLTLLGVFLLSSIQAVPVPQEVQVKTITRTVNVPGGGVVVGGAGGAGGAPGGTKTYTLPDGTVVHEVTIKQGDKTIVKKIVERKMSQQDTIQVTDNLGKLPNVIIVKVPGASDKVRIPAQQLILFLNQNGFSLPSDVTQVPGLGKDPNGIIEIYLDKLFNILANKERFLKAPAGRIIFLLKQNPAGNAGPPAGGNVKLPAGNVKLPAVDAGVNSEKSYLANTGINRRQDCGRGLVDEAATAVRSTVNGLVGSVADALGSGVLGAVGHGASALLTHAISGIDFAIQDAACGLGNIADEIASGLDNGDLIGAVGKVGQEFFGGIANMAEDLVSEAGAGVGQAAGDIFGFIQDLG